MVAERQQSRAQVQYRPASGDTGWWIAVEDAALAVLAPSVTAQTADAVWRRLGDGGIGAVLDALTGAFGTSLTAIPPFALVVVEAGGVRVAVRGALDVIVDASGAGAGAGAVSISGENVATWAERFVAGATRVTVTPTGVAAEEAAVPLRSGVAPADLVVVRVAGGVVAGGAVAGGVSAGGAAAEIGGSADRRADVASADVQISAVVTAGGAVVDASVPPSAETLEAPAAPLDAPRAPVETSADTWLPEKTDAADAPPAAVDEYDLLWGETVARPITAAAVITATDDDGEAAPATAPASTISVDGHPDASASIAPAVTPPTPQPAAPVASADLGDHDGATISVAEARALRAAESGHPAPVVPESAAHEHYESTDNVPPRRPARGRIVLSTGRVVELERPVVIGRRPKSTRTSGSELPTLVAVDSPEQDISRSHVEIRAEGEHVLVTDLDTTNGTVLLRVGGDPVRLHPNEPTMVVTGDVLDLGDGVTVTFEGLS